MFLQNNYLKIARRRCLLWNHRPSGNHTQSLIIFNELIFQGAHTDFAGTAQLMCFNSASGSSDNPFCRLDDLVSTWKSSWLTDVFFCHKILYHQELCYEMIEINRKVDKDQACCVELHNIFYLRNRKHVPCFIKLETQVEVWESEKCCGNTSCSHSFFKFSQTFVSVSVTR